MANSPDREELIAELAASRAALTGYTAALRHDFDFGAKLKRSFRAYPAVWLGGAALLGLLLSRLGSARRKLVARGPAIRPETAAKAGKAAFALTALKFGLDFAKPALLRWVKDRYLSRSHTPR